MNWYYIIGIVAVALTIFVIALYNRLVGLRNYQREAWAAVDVFLKRRADLIPNLVRTVQGYSQHEANTLEAVIAARHLASEASPSQRETAEKQISGAMGQLILLAESYPELKADAQFSALQKELIETEDQLELVRRYYNGTVRDLNTSLEQFPTMLLARAMGFESASFFSIDRATEGQNPSIHFQREQ